MENEEQNLSNPAITSASQPDSTYEASPTPNVPENQPKRRSTRLIIFAVLGVLLLIGLVLGGGYYLGRNSVLKELNPTAPAIPPKDPVIFQGTSTPASNAADAEPTANWKTYENKIYNYSLKYPDDKFKIKPTIPDSDNLYLSSGTFCPQPTTESCSFDIYTGVFDSEGLSLEDWVNKKVLASGNNKKNKYEKVTISEMDAIKSTLLNTGQYVYLDYVFKNGDKIYSLTLLPYFATEAEALYPEAAAHIKEYNEFFEDIVSTFKFTK